MFRKIGAAFRRMMYGRYGSDELNLLLLILAVLISLCNAVLSSIFTQSEVFVRWISPSLSLLMLGLLGVNLYRCFSRNIYKRQKENRRLRNFLTRLKDRSHRYYRCPGCRQRVRVPKGRGKINIRCPKCGNKFVKKT
ncbi:MAG: hypothetical protein IJA48_04365 [Oscillospiraceae bacterium]|nr:hypothetical protein [Oscillospiraceae bacterium]